FSPTSVVSPCVTQVKQIMEEAVTRKFVHEDSSHIVSFCAAVEACVLHGLKRRAAGFLRSNKIAALFAKVGKSFPPAEELCRKAQELELVFESKRSQSLSYSESTRKMPKVPNFSLQAVRHLWIHTALIEKVLDKIVLYLVENSSKFYEKEAILMDPVDGPILASLLVGPCALEYTKMKTADHFWTNPSADELVQRHRIHSGHCRQDSPTKRPALCIQKRHSSSSMDERPSPSPSARDYVESLHQNSRATLLFGKNNVLVQPRDDMEAIPGYLSLHQTADCMTLKWTPNQLMNGSMGDLEYERSVYWDYAMTIRLEEIVYLHCHQQVDCGGTVVLVSQDGIQRPPLRFPRGGHLLQFLSCLENGLLPHGQLDPPLWSQRGKGKVFPKLKKRCPQGSSDSVSDKEEEEATDYVFRIVFPNSQSEFGKRLNLGIKQALEPVNVSDYGTTIIQLLEVDNRKKGLLYPSRYLAPELIDQGINMWHPTPRKSSCSSCSRSSFSDGAPPNGCNHERAPLKLLCDNMKNQIISRAFYGWLAYCRLLSTVRTHLSGLVNHTIVEPDVPTDAYGGLTTEMWQKFLQDCTTYEEKELLRLVYFGGVEPSLRKEVWPFLLGHYQFGMSEAERKESSQSCSSGRQRDSRLQSDSSSGTQVFESVEEVDQIESEPKSEDIKHVSKISNGTPQNGTSSPDSGHPSSRNFSVTSGQSDSLSTEDSGIHDPKMQRNAPVVEEMVVPLVHEAFSTREMGEAQDATESDESPSAIEMEEIPTAKVSMAWERKSSPRSKGNEQAAVPVLELRLEEAHGKPSSDGMNSEEPEMESLCPQLDSLAVNTTDEATSPVSSIGTTYSQELLDMYSLNLHRIDKDVQRCDRNYWYFTPANLEKLRNIMCSYIWQHLEIGYVQGMCDLLAPLLVILDDEAMALSCFTELMTRMNQNFPHGGAMDTHFANMRSLIQILDAELFELMHQNGDYTHFYFCYRWFLLDFKRELVYDDVFAVWEAIWAAKCVSSSHFVLFIALALVEIYRDIILENNMDFTDIIKFFNEMAEHHNIKQILTLARDLVCKVQTLIENK
uniref:Small G protein signaling modulator 1-like n=1 Tax=Sinocyclocheilus anshuiensis TaxID=1608454 RepID=A0A671SPY3_9TELE